MRVQDVRLVPRDFTAGQIDDVFGNVRRMVGNPFDVPMDAPATVACAPLIPPNNISDGSSSPPERMMVSPGFSISRAVNGWSGFSSHPSARRSPSALIQAPPVSIPVATRSKSLEVW